MSLADDLPNGVPEYVAVEQALIERSDWTYWILAHVEAFEMTVGEETLTDMNLLYLRSSTDPAQLRISQVNKKTEKKSGADWEWWFSAGPGKWVGLAVQAKKLDYKKHRYQNVKLDQCVALIQTAEERRPPLTPIYVFYSAPATNDPPELLGCRCVPASKVREYLSSSSPPPKLMFDFVMKNGTEWSQLAKRPSDESAADAAVRTLTELNGGTVPAGLVARPAPSEMLDQNGAIVRPLGLAPRALIFL
jgi:hypothetical protein